MAQPTVFMSTFRTPQIRSVPFLVTTKVTPCRHRRCIQQRLQYLLERFRHQPLFLPNFPELADDTATIGLDGPASSSGIEGAADPSIVEDGDQAITPYFLTPGATNLLSNSVTGASWYVLNTAANASPQGGDLRCSCDAGDHNGAHFRNVELPSLSVGRWSRRYEIFDSFRRCGHNHGRCSFKLRDAWMSRHANTILMRTSNHWYLRIHR